jgi:chemotaxis protein MotB
MRKKRHAPASHDRWLVSYADFITLLFAFFVVLFATGQADKRKKVQLAESIQSAFAQMGIFPAHPLLPQLSASVGGGDSKLSWQTPIGDVTAEAVEGHIREAAQAEIASGLIGVHESTNGLVISLAEAGFFESGAADVRANAVPVVDRIAAVLPQTAMRVEGYTDNVPIHTAQFASNWELSSARASTIARLLLGHANVHAEQMSVAGYAEFHPTADNATLEGRARNRRVDIVLLKPSVQ